MQFILSRCVTRHAVKVSVISKLKHKGLLSINYHSYANFSSKLQAKKKSSKLLYGVLVISSGITFWCYKNFHVFAKEQKETNAAEEKLDIPEYTADEVSEHDSKDKRIWVYYKSGVYDITDFISQHPGGEQILMASGGSLEPFWEIYAVHKRPEVFKLLEKHRIGNLRAEDRDLKLHNTDDPFAQEPRRHKILHPRSKKPFNAEPPESLLVENFITPNEIFYVRNHLPVPQVDVKEYELEVTGIGIKPITLKLDDIKTKFKKYTITAAIQCAGNRRSELNKVQEVKGLNWGGAAISNAEWSGARLHDVLKYAGVDFEDPKIQHIQFEGLDQDPASFPYGASIPALKALNPQNDVLLAYEMNGKELPRDHGYPIRIVAPGIVGARNVKWLGKIIVSDEESKSHWQKNDYKGFSPSTTWDTVDYTKSPAIQELPVNSVICKPTEDTTVTVKDNCLTVEGYAWSGGGRKIVRVDVSVDDGKSWHTAELVQDDSPLYRCWAWTLWKVKLPVDVPSSKVEIICKAVDSAYNVQPDTSPPIWNLRGVLSNAWHRIHINIKD